MRPSRILFVQKEGLFAEPIECEPGSLGLSKFAGRAPEPPHRARGQSGVPLAFYATLAHPFRLEGGVEYAKLPLVGASSDTSGELLSGSPSGGPSTKTEDEVYFGASSHLHYPLHVKTVAFVINS